MSNFVMKYLMLFAPIFNQCSSKAGFIFYNEAYAKIFLLTIQSFVWEIRDCWVSRIAFGSLGFLYIFLFQNGIICSLMRGGIAEKGGVRVGHRIIEINSKFYLYCSDWGVFVWPSFEVFLGDKLWVHLNKSTRVNSIWDDPCTEFHFNLKLVC